MPDLTAVPARRRARNPQGEGGRLREELIAAADRILSRTGDEEGLSLRAVAREAGVAAPSIYLHFADKRELVREVRLARFAELVAAIERAASTATGPDDGLRAGCLGYCRFALDHPHAYRVLFGATTTLFRDDDGPDRMDPPGMDAFFVLVNAVQACMDGGAAPKGDAMRAATSIWAALHGAVTLRQSVPTFPWPPIADEVEDILVGLVGIRPSPPTPPPAAGRLSSPTPPPAVGEGGKDG